MLLHGEQYLEIVKPIPTSGEVSSNLQILQISTKGSGSTVVIQVSTKDQDGQLICINEGTLFLRGASPKPGFTSQVERRRPQASNTISLPDRSPCAVVKQMVPENQAAIYRLSGDLNPLHIDPDFASKAGFKKPILHGLCSFGIAAHHVIQTFANNEPSKLKCIKARFSKHVFPGETVQTEMWKISPTLIAFQLRVMERNEIAVSNAFVELFPATAQAACPKAESGSKAAEIAAGLQKNLEKLPAASRSALVKKVAGSFQFEVGQTVFFIDLKSGQGTITMGKPSAKPDIVITVADKDFIQLAAGKMTGQAAFMKGLVKIKGNMMLAMKLDAVLKALSGSPQSKL